MQLHIDKAKLTEAIRRNIESLSSAVQDVEESLVSANTVPDKDLELYASAVLLCRNTGKAFDLWAGVVDRPHDIDITTEGSCNTIMKRVSDLLHNPGHWTPPADDDQSDTEWYKPFPSNVFPQYIEEYIDMICKSQQVDRAAVSCGILATTAAATMGRFWVKHPDSTGHHEHLPLYIVCIQAPSQRKSGALGEVTKPIFAALDPMIEEFKQKKAEVSARRNAELATKKALEKQITNASDDTERENLTSKLGENAVRLAFLESPANPNFLVSDVTPEALARLMSATNELAFLESAEAQTFQILCGIYSQHGVNLGLLNAGISGEFYKSNRSKDGGTEIMLKSPLLAILQYVQPDIWDEISKNRQLNGSGFMARILKCRIPNRAESIRFINKYPFIKSIYDKYAATIGDFFSIPRPSLDTEPVEITFSDDAVEVMEQRMQLVYDGRQPGGDYSDGLEESAGKMPGYASRIAAILHLLEHPCTPTQYQKQDEKLLDAKRIPISGDTAKSACRIAEFFLDNAANEHKEARKHLDDIHEKMLYVIIKLTIFKGKAFCGLRDVKRQIAGNTALTADADTLLQDLTDGGLIEIVTASTGNAKARTSVYVNPYLAAEVFEQLEE